MDSDILAVLQELVLDSDACRILTNSISAALGDYARNLHGFSCINVNVLIRTIRCRTPSRTMCDNQGIEHGNSMSIYQSRVAPGNLGRIQQSVL